MASSGDTASGHSIKGQNAKPDQNSASKDPVIPEMQQLDRQGFDYLPIPKPGPRPRPTQGDARCQRQCN